MKRRNLAGAFVAGAAAVLVAAPPVAAAPAPTFPPVDGGASVQTLTPSRPSTPALDDAFLSDLTRAGIRAPHRSPLRIERGAARALILKASS